MTNQEFFTAAVLHLRKQGEPAISASGCAYTMWVLPDGRKCMPSKAPLEVVKTLHCAVGGVMTPELRQLAILNDVNHNGVELLFQHVPEAEEFFEGVSWDLMTDVQDVHDSRDPSEWETYLRDVAMTFNLETPA